MMARHADDETGSKALALSREFLHRYWAQDAAWIRSVLDDSFMWIGALGGMYDAGADMFMDLYDEICAQMPRVRVAEEEFSLVACEPTIAVCVGRFLGKTDIRDGQAFADRQRFTYVWRVLPGQAGTQPALKLIHLHISNPMQQVEGDELFPVKAGRESHRYAQALAHATLKREVERALSLRDAEGTIHWVTPDAVLSAESHGRQTTLHTLAGDVTLPSYLTQVVEQLDGTVARVHRCYAVNPQHVQSFQGSELTLDDGTRIPVPVRRIAEVRALLNQMCQRGSDPI